MARGAFFGMLALTAGAALGCSDPPPMIDVGAIDARTDAARPIDARSDAARAVDAPRSIDADPSASDAPVGGSDAPFDPSVPRPVAPLSTATASSRRPTFRWALGATAEVRLELCADRACARVLETLDATGTSATPAADLPPGVVYWRLFGRTGTSVDPRPSPTWQLLIGRRSAPVDTSWGTTLDVNGDGYSDFAVGAPHVLADTGRVYLYLGGAAGFATSPATTLTGPDGVDGSFGASVASAGDVDGDGYADLVVGADSVSSYDGRAYVYAGGAAGLGDAPAATLVEPAGLRGAFGGSVASAGDVNRDGYADIVVGAWAISGGAGRAYVYLGGVAGLSRVPATTLTGPDGADGAFGKSVASAGDINGDGYADVAVGAYGVFLRTGRAYVYHGGAAGLEGSPATSLTGPDGAYGLFGWSVASAGDVNGDGYADLAVGAWDAFAGDGRAYVYLGRAGGLGIAPSSTLSGPGGHFGGSVASAGDVNGDGYADLVAGAPVPTIPGRAHVCLGSSAGVDSMVVATLAAPGGASEGFGMSVASVGDVNRDGFASIAVGDPYYGSGRVHIYAGNAAGVATSPAMTLRAPDAAGYFGLSVAGAAN